MKEEQDIRNADLMLRKVRIVWPGSDHDGQELDISVKKGQVEQIGVDLEASGDQNELRQEGLHISPGWMDLNANFRDPGNEEREDLASGIGAAMQGGYTRALIMPATVPPIDHRGAVEDLKARSKGYPFTLHPAGTLSKHREGEDIAELFDMQRSGALAFTDARRPVNDAGLLMNALYYAKTFDGRILTYPDDPTISRQGVMNEGALSMRLGMKGIPHMSEGIAVDRALSLLEYTEGKLHFSTLSTPEALDRVRKAKKEGLQVSCDVAAHHLYFDEEQLKDFSPLFKLMPPLRDVESSKELRKAVTDGTVDHVCSLHEPHAEEDKRVEFEIAAYGAPGLETCFGAARTVLKDELPTGRLIESFTRAPRELLGLGMPVLEEGIELEATLFQPDLEWTWERERSKSKAYRDPYEGERLIGKPLGTVHQGQFHSSSL